MAKAVLNYCGAAIINLHTRAHFGWHFYTARATGLKPLNNADSKALASANLAMHSSKNTTPH
jgi:hypothetical protein